MALPAPQGGLLRELADVEADLAVCGSPHVASADHRPACHVDPPAGELREEHLAVVEVRIGVAGRLLGQARDDRLRRLALPRLLLQVAEDLHVEHGHDVGVEKRLQPYGLVDAQRLQRRLVEDHARSHQPDRATLVGASPTPGKVRATSPAACR